MLLDVHIQFIVLDIIEISIVGANNIVLPFFSGMDTPLTDLENKLRPLIARMIGDIGAMSASIGGG